MRRRVSGLHVGTAAGRQDLRAISEQPCDDLALAVAEMRFSMVGENFVDRLGGGALDLFIGIDERQAEFERQALADRRLAAAHQADEHDGALAEALFAISIASASVIRASTAGRLGESVSLGQ